MVDCKPIISPLRHGSQIFARDGEPFEDPSLYRIMVDIAYAVNQVCLFMHSPIISHWLALKRILWHLKGTITYGLLCLGCITSIYSCFDAD